MSLSMKPVILFLILCLSQSATALDLRETDPRYCGEPARDAKGDIKRSQAEIRKFKAIYPCELAAAKHGKTCSDFQIDHVIPLECGGCDKIWNMQWLDKLTKICKEKPGNPLCKDRYEADFYCPDGGFHK